MNDQEVRDEIKRRQEAAGPGVAINISDLVAARMKAPEGFTMKLVSPEEAKASVRTVHIDILCKCHPKDSTSLRIKQNGSASGWKSNLVFLTDALNLGFAHTQWESALG